MLTPLKLDSNEVEQVFSPSFIGVGTPKAGTSWWFELMVQHPKIEINRFNVKETCFFCHGLQQNDVSLNHYVQGFRPTAEDMLVGEWSTLYFSHPFALHRVMQHFPETKILVSFRDPVTTLYSWLNQLMRNRAKKMLSNDDESRYMYLNYDAFPSLFNQILRYPEILKNLQNVYKDNLLCLQYEKNVLDTQRQLDMTMRFLGQEPFYVADRNKKVNESNINLIDDLNIPISVRADLIRCGKQILSLCPEFDGSLWLQ